MRKFAAAVVLAAVPASTECAFAKEAIVPRSAQEREALLARGKVWNPVEVESMNILEGPRAGRTFALGETLRCTFEEPDPDDPPGGATPKFFCIDDTGDDLKVKYGADNGEVPAEIAASRLLWALGFFADRNYSVRVECHNCPREPWTYIQHVVQGSPRIPPELEPQRALDFERGERVFVPATVEKKYSGRTIERHDDEGWKFRELLDFRDVPHDEQIHREALVLLLSMLQHADSKPAQQRMTCLKEEVIREADGHETCRTPHLLAHDLGWTFGRGAVGLRNSNMELADWRNTPVWKSAADCRAGVNDSLNGSFETISVREEARAFLAALLLRLSRKQIEDIFRAARVELRSPVPPTQQAREARIQEWTDVFERKRKEIADTRCPR